MYTHDRRRIMKVLKSYNDKQTDIIHEVSSDYGMDIINDAYDSNEYGHALRDSKKELMKLMRCLNLDIY